MQTRHLPTPSTLRLWPSVSGGMWTPSLCCHLHLGHFVVGDISKSVTHIVGLPADTSAILSRNHNTNLYVYLLNRTFILDEFYVQFRGGLRSICIWKRWNMLCTSGFVDDVKFSRNGLYDRVTLPRQSCCNVFHGITPLLCDIGYMLCQTMVATKTEDTFMQGRPLQNMWCNIALLLPIIAKSQNGQNEDLNIVTIHIYSKRKHVCKIA